MTTHIALRKGYVSVQLTKLVGGDKLKVLSTYIYRAYRNLCSPQYQFSLQTKMQRTLAYLCHYKPPTLTRGNYDLRADLTSWYQMLCTQNYAVAHSLWSFSRFQWFLSTRELLKYTNAHVHKNWSLNIQMLTHKYTNTQTLQRSAWFAYPTEPNQLPSSECGPKKCLLRWTLMP